MVSEFLIPRIILMIISVVIVVIFVKIKTSQRIGNQFFAIMMVFWSGIFLISLEPSILDQVLTITGLANRAQFLLVISIIVIIYMLAIQTMKNQNLSLDLHRVVRDIAISNFKQDFGKVDSFEVLIIIIAKDEEKSIGSVIDKINSQKLPFSYKILVVNDGSIDSTGMIAKQKGAMVVNHGYNLGVGGVTKTGLVVAKILNPKIAINIDADDQHDPKYISKIISKIKNEDYDLVYGSRFSSESTYKTSAVRALGNKMYTNLVNRIAKISITDVTSGYRAVKTDKINSIYFVSEKNFSIELALRAAKRGLKISEVSMEATSRGTGKSQFHKIDMFIIYNARAIMQIFNAYFRNPKLD